MGESSSARASTEVSQLIKAPPQTVYRAFIDKDMVAAWQHPDNMRLKIHNFDPREGGKFRISLTYLDQGASPAGKTAEDMDTYHGRFTHLIPFTTISEVVEFETQEAAFAGEMRITVTLTAVDDATHVTYRCDDLPPGVRPEDNEAGCRESLQKLATLIEGKIAGIDPSTSSK